MNKKLAKIVIIILGGLTIFQILLIFGAPFGRFAWGGQNEILPNSYRIGSVFSIFIYAAIGAVVLRKAKIIAVFKNQKKVNVAMWVITAYFGLGILLNLASRSASERIALTPIVLVLFISCLLISRDSKAVKNT